MTFINRLIAAALLLATLGLVHAQSQPPGDQASDPPGRVARLSEFSGQVWLFDTDANEWIAATRNQPVAAGDRLATDAGARAELQLGSTTVRLDSSTEVEVAVLDDERLSLDLTTGSVAARIVDIRGAGEFDVSTDEGRLVALGNGSYRFDRDGSTSRATVYSGQARYEGQNSALTVSPGQRAEFWIDSGGVAQYALSAPVNDPFAGWVADLDRRSAPPVATRYVSPEMTGAEDLDRYGRWEQSPDYGALWIPTTVAVDWAPYRSGHWAWVRPWGWTWVDDAPWGFAPFHYGRWVQVRNTWCWAPGTRVARPLYAPALVAWVGTPRANVSVRIGGGPSVGWFPLAPREVYVPSYRVSPRYARDINVVHGANPAYVSSVFANPQRRRDLDHRNRPIALTMVPSGVITSRQPVWQAAAQMRQNPQWREAATQPGRAPIVSAPPVAAPPPRSIAPGASVRPPPGFAERPAFSQRPGFGTGQPGRDRDDRDRDGRGRDGVRAETPRMSPPVVQRPPVAGQPVVPAAPAPAAPVEQAAPMMRTQPVRRAEDRRELPPRPVQAAPAPTSEQPPTNQRPPARQPQFQQPQGQQPQVQQPQPPQMRQPRPVLSAPPQAQQPQAAPPQMRVERPAAPAAVAPPPRVAPPAPVRAPEAARPMPPALQQRQAPPEMRRGDRGDRDNQQR